MDELKQAWTELKPEQNTLSHLSPEDLAQTEPKSSGVIEKLRKNVKMKLAYAIFFTGAFAFSIPFAFPMASQILLSVLFMAYLIASILLYQELQTLNKGVDMSQDVLHGMIEYRDRIKRVLHYEEVVALALYPVSVSGGFFFGLKLYNRQAEIMNRTAEWVLLILLIATFTIGGHWLSRWLNRRAFGKYLNRLNESIQELKAGNN